MADRSESWRRTEKHVDWLVRPPAEDDEEREPEEQKLDAQVNRTPLGKLGWWRRCPEEEAERVSGEEERSDGAVGRERDEGDEDDAEPPAQAPRASANAKRNKGRTGRTTL